MEFTTVPGLVLITSTVIVQLAAAANVAPVKATLLLPGVAVSTPAGHVVLALAGVATCIPLGLPASVPPKVK